MGKVRYEIDPHNRLVIKKTGKKAELKRFRQVLDGRFKVAKDSTLTYHIKASIPQDTLLGLEAPGGLIKIIGSPLE
jgi:hypothetical protein